jgi:hypothetical protein
MIEDLKELNKQLAYKMMNVIRAENADTKIKMNHLGPRLVFPLSRAEKVRISEQESKIIFCSVLNNTNYYYSVETPTKEEYGRGNRSALSDMSIYTFENNNLIKHVNVELKSGVSNDESIRKDLEKLIRENYIGNWVHTIESVNKKNLNVLFDRFIKGFKSIEKQNNTNKLINHECVYKPILFTLLIIDKNKIAIMKLFDLPDADRENYISDFFNIDYDKLINNPKEENYGWEILTF